MAKSTIFRGGTVIDGTGAAPHVADVLVTGDRIAAIEHDGVKSWSRTAQVIDIGGRVICPGFIDVHTHDDLEVFRSPEMACKTSQGVTTVVVGNCGLGVAPVTAGQASDIRTGHSSQTAILGTWDAGDWLSLGEYLAAVNERRPAVNVAALVPHNTVRSAVCGDDELPATEREVARMAELVERGMSEGALGLSTGLIYRPGRAASAEELIALCRVVQAFGGLYVTHLRDEADGLTEALHEAFEIGEKAACGVHISHLKAAGRSNWGRIPHILRQFPASATTDVYPYPAASTSLREALLAGGRRSPIRATDVLIASSPGCEEAEGKSLAVIAQEWGLDPDRLVPVLEDRCPLGITVVYFAMDESDVAAVLAFDRTMVGSDGLPTRGKPHPRLYGTFPRVIGKYCRELGLFGLAEAVRRMTSFPAARFGFLDRGVLKPGNLADIVVFDPSSIIDTATYIAPVSYARGIEVVAVNGVICWERGASTGLRGGRALLRGS